MENYRKIKISCFLPKLPFNNQNYLDKVRGEAYVGGGQKILFLSTLRVSNLSRQGGGSNNGKIMSTLNAPPSTYVLTDISTI